jgi:hypothetical protein
MKSNPNRLEPIAGMPPLKHKDGAVFDQSKSEVMNWIVTLPSVRKFVFDKANQSGLIVFNKTTGTWQGRDWKGFTF